MGTRTKKPTAFSERLAEWRRPENWDSPPDDEQVLGQLIYDAITDFLESEAQRIVEALTAEDANLWEDLDYYLAADWLDRWSRRDPGTTGFLPR